jgi:hypothetical protein
MRGILSGRRIPGVALGQEAAGATAAEPVHTAQSAPAMPRRHVVLIGASIGQAWNLAGLPQRTGLSGFRFEALQAWQYDKSELIEETLLRPVRQFRFTPGYVKGFFRAAPTPADLIILKECSSYFPDDARRQRTLMREWVQRIRSRNIAVMLATVVPVTRERSGRDPGKQAALCAFNDWLREFARERGLVLLDLEQALRADDRDRYLQDALTSGDGSHLNRQAYEILDRLLLQSLSTVFAARGA